MTFKELPKEISLFCDVDETGKMTNILMGKYVLAVSEYGFFFKVDRRQEANIDKYRVNLETRKLEQIEGTEITPLPEDLVEPEESEEVKELKRRLAELEAKLKEQEGSTEPEPEPTPEPETPPETEQTT